MIQGAVRIFEIAHAAPACLHYLLPDRSAEAGPAEQVFPACDAIITTQLSANKTVYFIIDSEFLRKALGDILHSCWVDMLGTSLAGTIVRHAGPAQDALRAPVPTQLKALRQTLKAHNGSVEDL